MNRQRLVGYGFLFVAMTIVGSSVVVAKIVTEAFPVFLASLLRLVVGSLVLTLAVCGLEGRRAALPATGTGTGLLIAQTAAGVLLPSVGFLYGVRHVGAAEAGVVLGSLPAVTAILSALLLRERLAMRVWLGVALSVAGAVLLHVALALDDARPEGGAILLGASLIFAAVLGEALFTMLGKRSTRRLAPLRVAQSVATLGVLMFLIPGLAELASFDPARATLRHWGALAYAGVILTALAFFLFYAGLARVPASHAGVFSALVPTSAVVLSAICLGEELTAAHGWGLLAVCTGLALVTVRNA